jgi:hypothetical protein
VNPKLKRGFRLAAIAVVAGALGVSAFRACPGERSGAGGGPGHPPGATAPGEPDRGSMRDNRDGTPGYRMRN